MGDDPNVAVQYFCEWRVIRGPGAGKVCNRWIRIPYAGTANRCSRHKNCGKVHVKKPLEEPVVVPAAIKEPEEEWWPRRSL